MIRWIKSWLTHRGKALSLYRAGMVKADKRDYRGAIADYSAAIQAPDIPVDVKAMATYNRAIAYSAIHEDQKASADLTAILQMPGLSEKIRAAAHHRQMRIKKREAQPEERD